MTAEHSCMLYLPLLNTRHTVLSPMLCCKRRHMHSYLFASCHSLVHCFCWLFLSWSCIHRWDSGAGICNAHLQCAYDCTTLQQQAALTTGNHCMLQDYIHSIGSCLLEIGDATEGPLVDVMHKLTDESSQLLGCIKLLNVKVLEAMLRGEMDPTLAKTQSISHASSVASLFATSLQSSSLSASLLLSLLVERHCLHLLLCDCCKQMLL